MAGSIPFYRPALRRIRAIHEAIAGGACPNADALAERFEMSRRTVVRDIEFLRDSFGAPVRFDAGQNGYVYAEPYALPADVRLTEGELVALYVAERCLEAESDTPTVALIRRALSKLEERLPDAVRVSTEGLEAALGAVPRGAREGDPEVFRALLRAVDKRQRLQIAYHSLHRERAKPRRVDPLRVVRVGGDWYLIAFDHARKKVLQFVPSRIRSLRPTGETFDAPRGFSLEEHLGGAFRIFTTGRRPARVRLRFWPPASRIAQERFIHPTARWTDDQVGGAFLEMRVETSPELVSWILGWLPDVEVLAPRGLRDSVARAAADGARKNGLYGPRGPRWKGGQRMAQGEGVGSNQPQEAP